MPRQLQSLMLPVSMIIGFLFSKYLSMLMPITPYLIFVMLFVTFCRITPRQMKFSPLHFILLGFQILVSLAIYFLVSGLWSEIAAQGLMICVLAPTATSAVVIAGMLGADLATMATFTMLSNIAVAAIAPVIFSYVGTLSAIPFLDSFLMILLKVGPLLVTPFVAAFLLMKLFPKAHQALGKAQIVSFYLWTLALMVVTGQTVEFVAAQPQDGYRLEISIAGAGFFVCVMQFAFGRYIGRKYGDTVAGGQSLGQKNTILAIWMAQTYLEPIASIGPASYVLWQNVVNSWQLWRMRKKSV